MCAWRSGVVAKYLRAIFLIVVGMCVWLIAPVGALPREPQVFELRNAAGDLEFILDNPITPLASPIYAMVIGLDTQVLADTTNGWGYHTFTSAAEWQQRTVSDGSAGAVVCPPDGPLPPECVEGNSVPNGLTWSRLFYGIPYPG
jgi:hypothetical protein